MSCEIITLGEIHFIGKRISCAFEEYEREIPKAKQELQERFKEIKNVVNPAVQLGIHKENGNSEFEEAYFIGFEVKLIESVPEEMVSLTIPAQTYGKIKYIGPAQNLHDGYADLNHWISQEGHENLRSSWIVEFIPTSKNREEELHNFEMDICIPIKMK